MATSPGARSMARSNQPPAQTKPREAPPPVTRAVDPAPELARASELMPLPRPHLARPPRREAHPAHTCAHAHPQACLPASPMKG